MEDKEVPGVVKCLVEAVVHIIQVLANLILQLSEKTTVK